ncbi:MAG: fused response regulator/phosphatase [Magnetococcales bacterium]|nr:fused response regulator/phosphatase [Magnetococcales bacterium]
MESAQKTILVVDDERLNINILVDSLEGEYTILVAKNGEQALKRALGNRTPDLILLDIMMPGMNGHEVLKHLKQDEKTREIPVIFVTAMGQFEDETLGLELGAVDYIRKPFNPSVVRARVRNHLSLRDAYRALEQKNQLLHYERTLVENIILRMRQSSSPLEHLTIVATPVEKTAGDIVLWADRPDGINHILVGDFTGHGLPAAVGGPLLDEMFQEMTRRGKGGEEILSVVNRKLHQRLPPDLFTAACLLEWDAERWQCRIWNCAMPEVLVLRRDGRCETHLPQHTALGVVADFEPWPVDPVTLEAGDRIVVYSDGVVETTDSAGRLFGIERLISALNTHPLDRMTGVLDTYRGEMEQSDDITLMMLERPPS